MTDIMKDIINDAIYNMMSEFIINNVPFTFVLDNHNNWDKPLPSRLVDQKQILFDIKEDSLEDSFVENGEITIVVDLDGELYTKKIEPADILAIQESVKSKMPFIIRPFKMKPTQVIRSKNKRQLTLDDAGIQHSMNMFRSHNPKYFKED